MDRMRKLKLANVALAGTLLLGGLLGFSTPSLAASTPHDIADRAQQYVGYRITDFGSADFVSYVFAKAGIEIPDNLHDLSREGNLILNKNSLKAGDVVFFGTSRSNLLAAGIYTGSGGFIVAYKPYDRIKRMSLADDVAKKFFLGAKRMTFSNSSTPAGSKKPAWEVTADKVIDRGMRYLGVDYKLGADYDQDGSMKFDCSSFTQYIFEKAVGFDLNRTSRAQFISDGNEQLTRDELRKGDLVFFATEHNYYKYDKGDYRRNGHVGVVKEVHRDGSIDVLHTAIPGVGVTVQTMDKDGKSFLSKAFLYGKRIIADNGAEAPDVTMPKAGLTEGK